MYYIGLEARSIRKNRQRTNHYPDVNMGTPLITVRSTRDIWNRLVGIFWIFLLKRAKKLPPDYPYRWKCQLRLKIPRSAG